MKRALVCMRVALLLPLLPLGSCFCSTTTSEGEEPVELDRFVPVKVVSLAESSPVRGAALVRPGTALVVLGKATPDYWAVFDDHSAVHVVARGPVAAPEEATLTWGSSTLTLTHDGAGIVGGTYTGPDGVPVAFDGADGTQEQALVAEDIDRADDVIDDTLRYLEAGCTHYVVGWFCDRSDDVKDIAGRLQEAQDAWRDLTDYVPPERGPDDEPAAQAQQELYTEQAIGSSLPDNPSADDIVALAAEIEARRAGDAPATNHLPDEVSAPTDDPEAPLAPASWAPDLVRCFKEYRDGDNLAVIEHACVGTPMDCEDAGGEPSARLPDCDGWCERNAALAPGLTFEELDGSGDVLCHPLTCVEAFTPDSATVTPLVNEQCCINGFVHPVCNGATEPTDPTDPNPPEEECRTTARSGVGMQVCPLYTDEYFYTSDNPANGVRFIRSDRIEPDGSLSGVWALFKNESTDRFTERDPEDYSVHHYREADGVYFEESILVKLLYLDNAAENPEYYGSLHSWREVDRNQETEIVHYEELDCGNNHTRHQINEYASDGSFYTNLEDSSVPGYVGCPQVEDAVALAASFSPAPMSWEYVVTTPAYLEAQSIGQ